MREHITEPEGDARNVMNVEEILKELTLEEKVSLLEGADMGFTNPVKRLGIPRILLADGPHGLRVVKGTDAQGDAPYRMAGEMEETTALPCEAAMASAWNTELLEKAGAVIGEECQQFGVGVILGPGADGKRSPLGGRNFEYYSEDPYLSGKMAAAFINGVQSEGVGACLKHYVLNDQETRRMSVDVHVEERPLWEIYLKPFEIAAREAKPWCIMAAYNKAGGAHLTENKFLLQDVLRDRLGYEGVVVSDWNAVKDKVLSIKNGLDLQMPGPSMRMPEVMAALESGALTEREIDIRVKRVLELVKKVTEGQKKADIDWETHHQTAIALAEEGTVLLKNEDHILPLEKNSRIAVIGELAEKPFYAGGGSASLLPKRLDIPRDCMEKMARIRYARGYQGNEPDGKLIEEACHAAKEAETVVIFAGVNSTEGLDRKDLLLPKAQAVLIREVARVNPNVVLVAQCGSALEYRQIEGSVKAILHAWIPGEGCGSAIARLLFGEACPSGRLAESFPAALENTPAFQYFPGYKDDVYYHEGLLTGYRYYDTKKIAPQYPFGFGLSYTSFSYDHLKLSAKRLHNAETLTVSVEVTNTGDRSGKEVVQVYVSDCESHLFRPKKELKGFAKVCLAPGETRAVSIDLEEEAFSYYVPHLGRFAVESGSFEILVGASSRDIRLKGEVEFFSKDDVRPPLTTNDMFRDFLADDRYERFARQLLALLGMDESHMFYELLYGGCLNQLPDLLGFMGIGRETALRLTDCLVNRKELML